MKERIGSAISRHKFSKVKSINDIPNSPGIFIIASCPLVETNPSEWSCTPIHKGESSDLKTDIESIVMQNQLGAKHETDLTFFFLAHPTTQEAACQQILADIGLSHKTGK